MTPQIMCFVEERCAIIFLNNLKNGFHLADTKTGKKQYKGDSSHMERPECDRNFTYKIFMSITFHI